MSFSILIIKRGRLNEFVGGIGKHYKTTTNPDDRTIFDTLDAASSVVKAQFGLHLSRMSEPAQDRQALTSATMAVVRVHPDGRVTTVYSLVFPHCNKDIPPEILTQ